MRLRDGTMDGSSGRLKCAATWRERERESYWGNGWR